MTTHREGAAMLENEILFQTIDDYIKLFSPDVQEILETIRIIIKEAAPDAKEKISYQMPTFELYGNLVHFAAYNNHIGFYPAPNGIHAFKSRLSEYKGAKGSVQFPLGKPIPYELIREIVQFRVAENLQKQEDRVKNKTKKA